MKKYILVGVLAFALVLSALPFGVSAADAGRDVTLGSSSSCSLGGSSTGLSSIVGCVIYIFNNAIYLMIAASVVYIVYGAFLMITSEEKRDSGKQIIYHGVIGLFVMISIWGFVNILDKTFGLSGVQSNQVIPQHPFIQ